MENKNEQQKSKSKIKFKQIFSLMFAMMLVFNVIFAIPSFAKTADEYKNSWGTTTGDLDNPETVKNGSKRDINTQLSRLISNPNNADSVATELSNIRQAAKDFGYTIDSAVYQNILMSRDSDFKAMSSSAKDTLKAKMSSIPGLEDLYAAMQSANVFEKKNDYNNTDLHTPGAVSGSISLNRIPEGSQLAHIYFSKARASDSTNDLTVSLAEIGAWKKAFDSSSMSYGKQPQPSAGEGSSNNFLAKKIAALYEYKWITAEDARNTADSSNSLIKLVNAKISDFHNWLEKMQLSVSSITSAGYQAITATIGEIYKWLAQFSIPGLFGYSDGRTNPNSMMAKIFRATGIDYRLIDPARDLMMVVLAAAGIMVVMKALSKGMKNNELKNKKTYGYFIRVMTIILTIPVTLSIYSVAADIGNQVASSMNQSAEAINDEYFVDTLAWAAATNFDTTAISSNLSGGADVEPSAELKPTKDKVAALNRSIRGRLSSQMQRELDNISGGKPMAYSINKFTSGERATVEDYFKIISASKESNALYAGIFPNVQQQIISTPEGEYKMGNDAPYFLSSIGDDKNSQGAQQPAPQPGSEGDNTNTEEAKKKPGQLITLYKKDGSSEDITLDKDAKMVATKVKWNIPSTYIYGAAPVGSVSKQESMHDNFLFGKKSEQGFNPKTGTDGKFESNAAAIAALNMTAGTTAGNVNGPLSTQSVAFLLQSSLSNGALNYRGYNTVASSSGETKNVGKNGVSFLRYTMPAPDDAYVRQVSSELNLKWTGAFVAAIVAIIAAIKTPLIKGLLNSLKHFFRALFLGDAVSLIQHAAWWLCTMMSMVFVVGGISLGAAISSLVLELPLIGTLIAKFQSIPLLGPIFTILVLYGFYKLLTFKVIHTGGMEVNLVEAFVIIPYLIVAGIDVKAATWRTALFGNSLRGGKAGVSNNLRNKQQKIANTGKNVSRNVGALGKGLAAAGVGAAGMAAYQHVKRGKNLAKSALQRNTGQGDANVDATMGYGGLPSAGGLVNGLNKHNSRANEQMYNKQKASLEKPKELYDAQGNKLDLTKMKDKDLKNLKAYDKDGRLIEDQELEKQKQIADDYKVFEEEQTKLNEQMNADQQANGQQFDENGQPITEFEPEQVDKYNKAKLDQQLLYDKDHNLIDTSELTQDEIDQKDFYDANGNLIDKSEYINKDYDPDPYKDQNNDYKYHYDGQPENELNNTSELENKDRPIDQNKDQTKTQDKDKDNSFTTGAMAGAAAGATIHHMNSNDEQSDEPEESQYKQYYKSNDDDSKTQYSMDQSAHLENDQKDHLNNEATLHQPNDQKVQFRNDQTATTKSDQANPINSDQASQSDRPIQSKFETKDTVNYDPNRRLDLNDVKDIDKETFDRSFDDNVNNAQYDYRSAFDEDLNTFEGSNVKLDDNENLEQIDEIHELNSMSTEQIDKMLDSESKIIEEKYEALKKENFTNDDQLLTGNKELDEVIRSSMNKVDPNRKINENPRTFTDNTDKVISDLNSNQSINQKDIQDSIKSRIASGSDERVKSGISSLASKLKQNYRLTDEEAAQYQISKDTTKARFKSMFDETASAIKSGDIYKRDMSQRITPNKVKIKADVIGQHAQIADVVKNEYMKAFNDEQISIINGLEKNIKASIVDKQSIRLDALKQMKSDNDQLNGFKAQVKDINQAILNNQAEMANAAKKYQEERAKLIKSGFDSHDFEVVKLDGAFNNQKAVASQMAKQYEDSIRDLNGKIQEQTKKLVNSKSIYDDADKQYKKAVEYASNFKNSEEKRKLEEIMKKQKDDFIQNDLQVAKNKVIKETFTVDKEKTKSNIKNMSNKYHSEFSNDVKKRLQSRLDNRSKSKIDSNININTKTNTKTNFNTDTKTNKTK